MAGRALLTEKHEDLVQAAVAWLRSCREAAAGGFDHLEYMNRIDALAAAVEPFMPKSQKVN